MCGIVGFWDKTGGRAAASGRIVLDHARGPGMPRARQRRRRPDRPSRRKPGPSVAWSIRIAGSKRAPVDRLAPLGPAHPAARRLALGQEAGIAALSIRSQPGRRSPTISNGPSAPAAAAWKFSVSASGSTWSSRSARRRSSRRPMASRPGEAPWPSATRECRPRAGSTSATRSRSGLTECPTSRPFTTAT